MNIRTASIAALLVTALFTSFAMAQPGYAHHRTDRSIESVNQVQFMMRNRTRYVIDVYWLNFKGQEEHYGKLRVGDSATIASFATHPWVFKIHGRTVGKYTCDYRPQQTYDVSMQVQYKPVIDPHIPVNVPRPGGYADACVNDLEVIQAANFAVQYYITNTGQNCRLVQIEEAKRQVVAGMNFRITMQLYENGRYRTVTAIVYKPLRGGYRLTNWS